MGKYMSNAFIQSLLLLALTAFMVTIYFMTTNISEQVALIETRLDRMESTILENANLNAYQDILLESHEGSLLAVWEAIESNSSGFDIRSIVSKKDIRK